jgi:hypothetical protein
LTDGEKEWRNREAEFEQESLTKNEILERWNHAWKVFFDVLQNLNEDDLDRKIYIRNMGQTVSDALNRQAAHYAYHIGQMIYLGKMIMGKEWISLSIPKGQSDNYNAAKFSAPKHDAHFADEFLTHDNKD